MSEPTKIWIRGVRMDRKEIIKFQLIVHCYINSITVSDFGLDIATGIGENESIELNDYAKDLCAKGVFTQEQAARTAINRLVSAGIVVKQKREGTRKRLLYLHPSIGIHNQTPIFVDVKALCEQ